VREKLVKDIVPCGRHFDQRQQLCQRPASPWKDCFYINHEWKRPVKRCSISGMDAQDGDRISSTTLVVECRTVYGLTPHFISGTSLSGDDAATKHVLCPTPSDASVHDLGHERHVSAGEDGQSHHVHIFIRQLCHHVGGLAQAGIDDSMPRRAGRGDDLGAAS